MKFCAGAVTVSVGRVMSVAMTARLMKPDCFFGSVMTSVFEPETGETRPWGMAVLVVRVGLGGGPTTVSAFNLTMTPDSRWLPLELPLTIQRWKGGPAFAPRVKVRVNTTSELVFVRENCSAPKIAKLPP